MPTILTIDGFRVAIFISDEHPPAHVHVMKAGKKAKIELEPVRAKGQTGMSRPDLARAIQIVLENRILLIEKWRAIHG